ncbi:hypothetical protein Glove_227g47 [Diversispora epigaea]|uniref:Uncharacterized protein n=1 Tax=Diversispora epigaea TaxID=1348612 RepID=A0A397IDX0_9GLOM|nr:hypothetical protein Glove_227g47 [Diversispora epigaea]
MSNNSNNSSPEKKTVQNNKNRKPTMQESQIITKKTSKISKTSTQTMKSLKTLVQVSATNVRDFKPYWNEFTKEMSQRRKRISRKKTKKKNKTLSTLKKETLTKWFETARWTYSQVLSAIENEGTLQNKKTLRTKCLNSENFQMVFKTTFAAQKKSESIVIHSKHWKKRSLLSKTYPRGRIMIATRIEGILALDSGVRTFSTGYSPLGLAVEWGKKDIGRIY